MRKRENLVLKREKRMCRYKNIRKQKGQATVETVLLMVILLGIATLILKEGGEPRHWMKTIVGTPGKYIRGMSIAGVWKECADINLCPGKIIGCDAIDFHPNGEDKTLQVQGVNSQ